MTLRAVLADIRGRLALLKRQDRQKDLAIAVPIGVVLGLSLVMLPSAFQDDRAGCGVRVVVSSAPMVDGGSLLRCCDPGDVVESDHRFDPGSTWTPCRDCDQGQIWSPCGDGCQNRDGAAWHRSAEPASGEGHFTFAEPVEGGAPR